MLIEGLTDEVETTVGETDPDIDTTGVIDTDKEDDNVEENEKLGVELKDEETDIVIEADVDSDGKIL